MSLALYSQDLGSFPASRAHELDTRFGIETVYALVWPDYEPPVAPIPQQNRDAFEEWRLTARVPLWAWLNCQADQEADAEALAVLDADFDPSGWLLDIEGEWTKGAKLKTVLEAAAKTGKPCRASLAGFSASHVEYDYRELERQGFSIEWQAYFNSGEGPMPAVAVSELYQASFVIPDWTYRHRVGSQYGFGRVTHIEQEQHAVFDSYLRPGSSDSLFGVLPREWGWTVDDRMLWPRDPDKPPLGLVMGRAAYARVRVALNVTRPLPSGMSWQDVAASARIPNARKRPISVYTAENATDEALAAIAEGIR